MARILPDRDIRPILGKVLIDASEELLNPNGIELRLGRHVLFHSTGEERELSDGMFLRVSPGENVIISSMEEIDFSPATVRSVFGDFMLMGLITPTTTMMREGISQVATKIDAGFRGVLNWGLRNGSTKPLILQYGEPIFKLTLMLLNPDESPDFPYGKRPGDTYQDAKGIARSTRRIPADIPKQNLISSGFEKLDPKKQLREAGYPFDHIGTELTSLQGKFELVSTDVRMMKDEFQSRIHDLGDKIESETTTLTARLDESRQTLLDKVEAMFDRKFLRVIGVIVGALPIMYGGLSFLRGGSLTEDAIGFLAVLVGAVILTLAFLVTRSRAT